MKTICTLGWLLLLVVPAMANSTIWETAVAQEFEKGGFYNTMLVADGTVQTNAKFRAIPSSEVSMWSAVSDASGKLYLGTGMRGIIYRFWQASLEKYYETGELIVTSLVAVGDTLYAATIPDGKIFVVKNGQGSLLVKLPSSYIWAMQRWQNKLYAATGTEGILYQIDLDTKEIVPLLKTTEKHLLSLAITPQGLIYAGSAPNGIVYCLAPGSQATVVFDLPENEVRGLAVANNKLYIGANASKGFDNVRMVQTLARNIQEQGYRGKLLDRKKIWEEMLSGVVYEYEEGKGWNKIFELPKNFINAIVPLGEQGILVGTGLEGRIYHVQSAEVWSIVADLKEEQVMTLVTVAGVLKFYGTGDTGALYLRDGQAGTDESCYVSPVHDTEAMSQWGTLQMEKQGRLTAQVRTGNTQKPDEFWTAWSSPNEESHFRIANPPGRFVQYKITWLEAESVLKGVRIIYRRQNRPPAIKSFKVPLVVGNVRKLAADKVVAPIQLAWEAKDPDNDNLRYRLWLRRQQSGYWQDLLAGQVYTLNNFKWDTSRLPDGNYSLKLEASDELDNAKPAAATQMVGPLLIDNNPPVVVVEEKPGELHGLVSDDFSCIAQIAYRVQGGEWILLDAEDGIFDTAEEFFKIILPTSLQPGQTLEIKGMDSAGNCGYVFSVVK